MGSAAKMTTMDGIDLQSIYEEVKTPFKAGMALVPKEGEMLDNPMVFRHDGTWFMMFIRFDGKGYETHLAKSEDLLRWTRLGCVFRRGAKGQWDSSQSDGWPALLDARWEGPNTLGKFDGRYWMMYLGGSADGYETDPLSTGVAWTDDPSAIREWTRYDGNPVLRPSDPDSRPFERATIYKHFTVELHDHGIDIVFHKSLKSDRWWMEVPCDDPDRRQRYGRHTLVPCSYSDYQRAMENEIPDLWWHYYNRINN